jgi:hypothetical protein
MRFPGWAIVGVLGLGLVAIGSQKPASAYTCPNITTATGAYGAWSGCSAPSGSTIYRCTRPRYDDTCVGGAAGDNCLDAGNATPGYQISLCTSSNGGGTWSCPGSVTGSGGNYHNFTKGIC